MHVARSLLHSVFWDVHGDMGMEMGIGMEQTGRERQSSPLSLHRVSSWDEDGAGADIKDGSLPSVDVDLDGKLGVARERRQEYGVHEKAFNSYFSPFRSGSRVSHFTQDPSAWSKDGQRIDVTDLYRGFTLVWFSVGR